LGWGGESAAHRVNRGISSLRSKSMPVLLGAADVQRDTANGVL